MNSILKQSNLNDAVSVCMARSRTQHFSTCYKPWKARVLIHLIPLCCKCLLRSCKFHVWHKRILSLNIAEKIRFLRGDNCLQDFFLIRFFFKQSVFRVAYVFGKFQQLSWHELYLECEWITSFSLMLTQVKQSGCS